MRVENWPSDYVFGRAWKKLFNKSLRNFLVKEVYTHKHTHPKQIFIIYYIALKNVSSIIWRSLLCFFFSFLFYCCSSIVVSIFSPPLPIAPAIPTSHPQSYLLWFCPCVRYRCSWNPSLFLPIIPSYLPSSYCQFVLNFNVSGYILLACLLCLLGST